MSLEVVPQLLLVAWLLPLGSFVLLLLAGPLFDRFGRGAGLLATASIAISCGLSLFALGLWFYHRPLQGSPSHAINPICGDWYTLAEFGRIRFTIGYYIDALTLAMFSMVSFVATFIHIYSFGYMHEELHVVRDPLVRMEDGSPLVRPGRFSRFFQYMSLFCFSMLGLVLSGNLLMVFIFWELVGICSYFLIGFYVERPSATFAGNKAFIVNRIGDFGMLLGLATLLASCGTLDFANLPDENGLQRPGLFSQVHYLADSLPNGAPMPGAHTTEIQNPSFSTGSETISETVNEGSDNVVKRTAVPVPGNKLTYALLIAAGLGLFCGCVGKSAQFPLHVWLPDAMEGPTPVSALIHAATMVAAGVYLVGRIYPVLTPEVLLVITLIGTITLFIAATIALTATDIKKVLAYSTISQLGYMMLGLGVGGWVAGLFHLFTHAFFKALLFLGAGSVIHACGTNEMPQMGGLFRKMPWTALTMLVGCLAIAGAGIPLWIGLSGYHSKDAILSQVFLYHLKNPLFGWVYYVALFTAGLTAFYMFRLWFLTFAGKPREEHIFAHAHESPASMVVPLVVLAFFALTAGWTIPGTDLGIPQVLEQAKPDLNFAKPQMHLQDAFVIPDEHESHQRQVHTWVSIQAVLVALAGFVVAWFFYGVSWLRPEEVQRRFRTIHSFLLNKWYFDELYDVLFVRNVRRLAAVAAWIDRHVIDWTVDHSALIVRSIAHWDDYFDRLFVDGTVNGLADAVYSLGNTLRQWQSGRIRAYILWILVGIVTLFILGSFYFGYGLAMVHGTT